jgi:hypothetical protein
LPADVAGIAVAGIAVVGIAVAGVGIAADAAGAICVAGALAGSLPPGIVTWAKEATGRIARPVVIRALEAIEKKRFMVVILFAGWFVPG